jgi:hypothetical protein
MSLAKAAPNGLKDRECKKMALGMLQAWVSQKLLNVTF